MFFVLATLLVIIFAVYVYLINKTVMNVVAREQTEQDIAQLSGTLGELEFKYITLKNIITLDLAYERGFQETSPKAFISRTTRPASLSYNYDR